MKFILQITLLILSISSFVIQAKEFSGVWATNCNNKNANPATLWIIRVTSDGLYQVSHPRLQMSKPTLIIGSKEFKIINDNTISYKNITYKRCSKAQTPTYNQVSEVQIKKYLQGKWKHSHQTISGRKNNISNGRTGIPDLHFINEQQASLKLKTDIRSIEYKVNDDYLLLKLDEWKSYKVLLVDEKEVSFSSNFF